MTRESIPNGIPFCPLSQKSFNGKTRKAPHSKWSGELTLFYLERDRLTETETEKVLEERDERVEEVLNETQEVVTEA